jgi:spore maturation protein CgeB
VRHIEPDEVYSLGPRAYEIAACGAFQVCDGTRPELGDVFNGHVPIYRDGAELLELVKYYLGHDKEREQKAAAAREAVQGCSFDDRATDIVLPFLKEITHGSTIHR